MRPRGRKEPSKGEFSSTLAVQANEAQSCGGPVGAVWSMRLRVLPSEGRGGSLHMDSYPSLLVGCSEEHLFFHTSRCCAHRQRTLWCLKKSLK